MRMQKSLLNTAIMSFNSKWLFMLLHVLLLSHFCFPSYASNSQGFHRALLDSPHKLVTKIRGTLPRPPPSPRQNSARHYFKSPPPRPVRPKIRAPPPPY
ncbi:hypothetical protein PHAVU_006G179200 [Phaseolus vulgaris]|uniref:Transmembrane protein n=1 Tax=Phaseolus vulgaris TaxID=3885 RepID=V7BU36_PHAVU|nr:hypothetical protein PHAVU_006G179200g [Phaseolus vulgaris]ESW20076.1 hypothetical protein PHAVU_006G179200g [Phaseolus vulgaris]